MATKKVEKLLKGVAVTGASVAGASMFGDGSMAYAAEVGLEDTLVDQTEVVVDLETVLEENQENLGSGAEEPTINVELSENDTLDSLTAALDEYEDQLEDLQEAYHVNGYDNEGLDKQQEAVQEKWDAEAAQRAKQTDLGKNNYYRDYGRPVAAEMIKYKLLQDGKVDSLNVDSMVINYWEKGETYETKHFCVQYIGTDGQYHEEYYDYVTAGPDGESLYQDGTRINGILTENYADNVTGLNVLEKKAVFASTPSATKTYTFEYIHEDGTKETLTGARYQRTDFVEVNGTKKGVDWYKAIEYLHDVAERAQMKQDETQLEQDIKTTEKKLMLVTSVISTTAGGDLFGGLTDDTEATTPAPAAVQSAVEDIAAAVSSVSSIIGENHVLTEPAAEAPAPQPAAQVAAVEQPVAVSVEEGAVPLAVIEDDNAVGTIANRVIGDEDVAKGHVTEIVQHGRQGLFYGIIAAISSIFAFGKLDEKTAKERK